MGGEGGGVLADWLVDLAEQNGFAAQATSVPGVAQRTGATIYYLEMFPLDQVPDGAQPVLGLSPVPGEVDVVIASELMEAGRALQRGLVTPGAHHLHRLHPPGLLHDRAHGHGRWPRRCAEDSGRSSCRGAPVRQRRFRGAGGGDRQPDQPGALRCAGGLRRAAVHARAVRANDSPRRRWRGRQPRGFRRGLRQCARRLSSRTRSGIHRSRGLRVRPDSNRGPARGRAAAGRPGPAHRRAVSGRGPRRH